MLRVIYYAVEDLPPGRLAAIDEERGLVCVRVARGSRADDYVPALNQEMRRFLSHSEWFQLWRDEIVSRHSRDPLTVTFALADLKEPDAYVLLKETKGLVDISIQHGTSADEFVRSINPAIKQFLAGAQWFQLFNGEIVDMSSPDNPHQGGADAGIRRGPLVDQEA